MNSSTTLLDCMSPGAPGTGTADGCPILPTEGRDGQTIPATTPAGGLSPDTDGSNQPFTQHMLRMCQTLPSAPLDESTATQTTDAEGMTDDDDYAIAAAFGLIEGIPAVTMPAALSTVIITEPVEPAVVQMEGQALGDGRPTPDAQPIPATPVLQNAPTPAPTPLRVAAESLPQAVPTPDTPLTPTATTVLQNAPMPASTPLQVAAEPLPQTVTAPDKQPADAPLAETADTEWEIPTEPTRAEPMRGEAMPSAEAGLPADAVPATPATNTAPARGSSNVQEPVFMPMGDRQGESVGTESGSMSDSPENGRQQPPGESFKAALPLSGNASAREISPEMNLQATQPVATATAAPTVISPTATQPAATERMQPAEMLERFDRIVIGAMRSSDNSMRIELEPAALGRVTVNCRSTADGLNVEIGVLGSGIRDLLVGQENDLRSSLAAQGFQLGQFSVSYQDREGQPQSHTQRGEEQESFQSPRNTPKQQNATRETIPLRHTAGVRNRWVA